MKRSHLTAFALLFGIGVLLGCQPAIAPAPILDVAVTPTNAYQISRHFPSEGITKVVFRSTTNQVEHQSFEELGSGATLEVVGNAVRTGLNPSDRALDRVSDLSQPPDFAAMKYGYTLVISTKNEINDDKQSLQFEKIEIRLPKGVQLVLEQRAPSAHGRPDLSQPKV